MVSVVCTLSQHQECTNFYLNTGLVGGYDIKEEEWGGQFCSYGQISIRVGCEKVFCSYFKGEESRSIERGECWFCFFVFSLVFFLSGEGFFKPSSCFPLQWDLWPWYIVSSELLLSHYWGKSRHPERSIDLKNFECFIRVVLGLCRRSILKADFMSSFRRHDVFRIFPLKSYES